MTSYIVDDIGAVVALLRPTVIPDPNAKGAGAPYYMYGHPVEINNRLLEKKDDKVFKYQRYPLIALKMDIVERVRPTKFVEYSLNLVIITTTDINYTAEERMTNTFKPILYPLYNDFMDALKDSGLFMWPGNLEGPEHVKIDRPYWGSTGPQGNVKSVFSESLDAIELIDLKLTSTKRC